jgi:hypothetical protein
MSITTLELSGLNQRRQMPSRGQGCSFQLLVDSGSTRRRKRASLLISMVAHCLTLTVTSGAHSVELQRQPIQSLVQPRIQRIPDIEIPLGMQVTWVTADGSGSTRTTPNRQARNEFPGFTAPVRIAKGFGHPRLLQPQAAATEHSTVADHSPRQLFIVHHVPTKKNVLTASEIEQPVSLRVLQAPSFDAHLPEPLRLLPHLNAPLTIRHVMVPVRNASLSSPPTKGAELNDSEPRGNAASTGNKLVQQQSARAYATIRPDQAHPNFTASPRDREQTPQASTNTLAVVDFPMAVRIAHPVGGQFDVVVVQTSLEEMLPEAEGVMAGYSVYTVYLQVGSPKEWVLHYASEESTAVQEENILRLPDPRPLAAPYPLVTYRPVTPLSFASTYLLVRGYLNSEGRFEQLKILGKQIRQSNILSILNQWQFRPAKRGDTPTRLEILLAIPAEET